MGFLGYISNSVRVGDCRNRLPTNVEMRRVFGNDFPHQHRAPRQGLVGEERPFLRGAGCGLMETEVRTSRLLLTMWAKRWSGARARRREM